MEEKKKFEKPQMEVLKLKPAYMVSACSNHCPGDGCGCYDNLNGDD